MSPNMHACVDQYVVQPHHFSAPALALVILGLLLILAFELWMLVDALAYRKMPTMSRIWWVLGMFLIHPFVAIVYFFVRGRYKQIQPK